MSEADELNRLLSEMKAAVRDYRGDEDDAGLFRRKEAAVRALVRELKAREDAGRRLVFRLAGFARIRPASITGRAGVGDTLVQYTDGENAVRGLCLMDVGRIEVEGL